MLLTLAVLFLMLYVSLLSMVEMVGNEIRACRLRRSGKTEKFHLMENGGKPMFGQLKEKFFTSKYKLNDRVVHAATRQYGYVVELQTMGGRQLVSVRLDSGEEIKRLDRREFMLASRG